MQLGLYGMQPLMQACCLQIPEAILTYAKATGPICMMFVPAGAASAAAEAAGMGS